MSEKEKKLWNRRWGVVLGALVVTFMVLIGTSGGDPMLDESPKKRWMFFDGWYPMTDSANARIFPYRQLADTALGAVDTLRFDSPDSGWSWVDIDSSGFYRFAHYNDHAATWVLDSVWVQGKYIAEGYVNLPWAFVADVIQAAAISDTSIHPRHVCADSFYVMGIDSGSVIDVDALPAANLLESEFETWFEPSFDESLMTGTYDAYFTDVQADSVTFQKIVIANTAEPALIISMTAITDTDNQAIDIVGGEALEAEEHWTGIQVKPDDLDPAGNDTRIRGVAINLSGVDVSNQPESFEALRITTIENETAIRIAEGVVNHDYTAPSTAAAVFPVHDFAISSEALVATSGIHILSASTVGTPSGTIAMIGAYDEIAPVHQHIGSYTTPSQTEFAGEKTGGGAVWVDGIDASEIFVVKNDVIAVGAAAKFSALEVIMTTGGTKTVVPTFWFATAADTWTQFYPVDNTNGFQQTGTIYWDADDLTGWSVLGDPGAGETTAGYWVKVIRSGNPDPGTPTPTTVKTGTLTEYTWDKAGTVLVAKIGTGASASADVDVGGGTLTTVDGTDDLLVADDVEIDGDIYIEGGLYVGGFQWDTGSGEMDWAQIEAVSSDVLINDAGVAVVQANALDDETLYSDDTPADGDLVGVGANNKFTHETPAERDIRLTTAPCPMDTTLYGTSTMPNTPTATWYEWKTGVVSGDRFDWGYTGAVPYHSVLGELSGYGVSVYSDQNGRVTFSRFPTSTASGGATGMWYYARGRP